MLIESRHCSTTQEHCEWEKALPLKDDVHEEDEPESQPRVEDEEHDEEDEEGEQDNCLPHTRQS